MRSSLTPRISGSLRPVPQALICTFVVVLAACFVASCSGDARDNQAPEDGDRVAARIQEKPIWASDVRREAVAQGLIGEGEPLDASSELFRRVLDEVIDQKLLAAEAERRGLDRSALAQRRLEATRERILGDMLVENVVNGTISDEAVRKLYDEQMRLARDNEEIRLRLIQSRTRQEADAVVGMLGQGVAFEAVASERSIDEATRFSGGDLGYSTPDVMPQAYANALRGKPAGAIVGPFETEGGWAVLRVEDRRKETPPTLEQARPQIVRYLTYEGVRRLLEDLRGKAEVNITPASGAASASASLPSPTAPDKDTTAS